MRGVGEAGKQIKTIVVAAGSMFANFGEVVKIARKCRTRGLHAVERYLLLLQSEQGLAQVSKERGVSPELLRALAASAMLFVRVKQWWFANALRREYSKRLSSLFHGETAAVRGVLAGHIDIHVDKPKGLFDIVDSAFIISGWCVDRDQSSAGRVRVRIGKIIHEPHARLREDIQEEFSGICNLPAAVGFAVVPSLPVGLHRMWIDAEGESGNWIPVRRALLLCRPQLAHWRRKREISYKAWVKIDNNRLVAERTDIARHIGVMLHKPVFSIIIDIRKGVVGLERSLKSLSTQIYQNYELYVLGPALAAFPVLEGYTVKTLADDGVSEVSGDFVVFIESGQCLSEIALYEFANAVNRDPDLDLIYGDEDKLKASGEREAPFYKPAWSPDYLETFNYIGFPACFRSALFRDCFKNENLYDLVLRFTEKTKRIYHVAKILGHETEQQAVTDAERRQATAKDLAALQGRIDRTGRRGTVLEHDQHPGCYEIELDLKRQPSVSVIIPTAAKTVVVQDRRIDLISNVVHQFRDQSTYKNIELIVVDNGDLSDAQRKVLDAKGCRRISCAEPVLNISRKLNLGASVAEGEILLLVNDDIEVIAPSWIERMLEHFEKPHVGVVGAKLLYPDGLTQHVGVVHNHGSPDHVRRLVPGDEAGYYFSTCGVRNFLAVTGAAMMTPARLYRDVGGYTEKLAVSYNDTDYCLKVHKRGLSVVYAPKAVLTHMESQSRVVSAYTDETEWYQRQWAADVVADPYYNERFLTVEPPTFTPCINERLL